MSGFLVDTSVLSAFAPDKPPVPTGIGSWMRARARSLHVSVVTFMEIEQGASKLRRLGGVQRADRLHDWLNALSSQYGKRVLAFDLALARAAGLLGDAASAGGRHPGLADIAIAATARANGLTLLTRNLRHFEPLGIDVLDPFAAQP